MGKRIACICGQKNRVQHQRMRYLSRSYLPYLDVYHISEKPNLAKYEVVYYTHFSLYDKWKFKGTKITSVTSHKYTKRALKKFDDISVNNKILQKELERFRPFLTENGVDTGFWEFKDRKRNEVPVIGWVGNHDRKAKRYDILRAIMHSQPEYNWNIIETSKHDNYKDLKTPEQMREYYQSLDLLLVVSETEGTPNPALEAMSCGTPVMSTPVGNMPDIKTVIPFRIWKTPIFEACDWAYPTEIPDRQDVRNEIEKWDWHIKVKQWDKFFRRYL